MAAISRVAGSTSLLIDVFIKDSSKTDGSGLTGLAYNTSGLVAYYHRSNGSGATSISLATMTAGTWATGGFVEVSSANMPGVYQLGIPNAAVDTGATYVVIELKGATNMAQTTVMIDLKNDADVRAIDGKLTSGNNATLNLKQLNIVNSAGNAIHAEASGGNGHGLRAIGNGTGEGLSAVGGATGHGIEALGGTGSEGGSNAGRGLSLIAIGGQAGLRAVGGATGNAVALVGGSTSGDGVNVATTSGDGVDLTGVTVGAQVNGTVPANLIQILGTALTETAGQIAAAFKKWFNVATPTGTVNSLPDAVAGAEGGLSIVGSKMDLQDAPNATAITAIQNGLATSAVLAEVWNAVACGFVTDSGDGTIKVYDGPNPATANLLWTFTRTTVGDQDTYTRTDVP